MSGRAVAGPDDLAGAEREGPRSSCGPTVRSPPDDPETPPRGTPRGSSQGRRGVVGSPTVTTGAQDRELLASAQVLAALGDTVPWIATVFAAGSAEDAEVALLLHAELGSVDPGPWPS